MKNWRGHIIALFLLLFVGIQTAALAHSAEYGCDPHDHESVACHIEAIAADPDGIEPGSAILNSPFTPFKTEIKTVFVSAAVVTPPGRAPPPRSPPYILL